MTRLTRRIDPGDNWIRYGHPALGWEAWSHADRPPRGEWLVAAAGIVFARAPGGLLHRDALARERLNLSSLASKRLPIGQRHLFVARQVGFTLRRGRFHVRREDRVCSQRGYGPPTASSRAPSLSVQSDRRVSSSRGPCPS